MKDPVCPTAVFYGFLAAQNKLTELYGRPDGPGKNIWDTDAKTYANSKGKAIFVSNSNTVVQA